MSVPTGRVPADEPLAVLLREVRSAFAVVASMDGMLDDKTAGPAVVRALQVRGIGQPGRDLELPAVGGLDAAPPVTDADSARLYLQGLRDRLRMRLPNGPLDPGAERVW